MTCRNCHQERALARYLYDLGRHETWLCDDCVASLRGLGMDLQTPIRQISEPRWKARLTNKDMTDRVVA